MIERGKWVNWNKWSTLLNPLASQFLSQSWATQKWRWKLCETTIHWMDGGRESANKYMKEFYSGGELLELEWIVDDDWLNGNGWEWISGKYIGRRRSRPARSNSTVKTEFCEKAKSGMKEGGEEAIEQCTDGWGTSQNGRELNEYCKGTRKLCSLFAFCL